MNGRLSMAGVMALTAATALFERNDAWDGIGRMYRDPPLKKRPSAKKIAKRKKAQAGRKAAHRSRA